MLLLLLVYQSRTEPSVHSWWFCTDMILMIYLFLNLHLKTIVFLLRLKFQLHHVKLTLEGFCLLCLCSFDLLVPNILCFWLSKISVSVVTDDGKSRNTCCAHGIQFLCHTVFLKKHFLCWLKQKDCYFLYLPDSNYTFNKRVISRFI